MTKEPDILKKSDMLKEADNFNSITLESALELYINSLDEFERIALDVAKQQLGSSFELYKSIGFIKYIKDNKIVIS